MKLGKDKRQEQILERCVGRHALQFGLFSNDRRSLLTNAAIIQAIATEGPSYLLGLAPKTMKVAAQWQRLVGDGEVIIARSVASNQERIQDLADRGYIFKQERKEKHPGPESPLWELTYRGAIAALALPGVRKGLPEFMAYKREGGLLRLPGLELISIFVDQSIAPDYWEHFIIVLLRKILPFDINETPDKELYETWSTNWDMEIASLYAKIQSKQPAVISDLRKYGWNEGTLRKYKLLMETNPEFVLKLRKILEQSETAASNLAEMCRMARSALGNDYEGKAGSVMGKKT